MQIIHLISNKVWGGGEQYVLDLAKHLQMDGLEPMVICRNKEVVAKRFKDIGVVTYGASLGGFTDLTSAIKLARRIRKGRNIIHAHNFKDLFTAVVAKSLSRIFSRNRDNRVIVTRHLVKRGKDTPFYRWIFKRVDKFIFVSHLAKEEFLSSGIDISDEHITVIHNSLSPISEDKTVVKDLREQYNIPTDKKIITYIGRLHPEKGVEVLLEAIAGVNPNSYHMLIVGSGTPEYTNKLKELTMAHKLTNNVTFTGYEQDVKGVISQSDIGVVPSIAREAFGFTMLEFMQASRAVISSNNGAQGEIATNMENAILIEPNDPTAITKSVNLLITDNALRDKLGNAAMEHYNLNFDYNSFYSKIKDVYLNIN